MTIGGRLTAFVLKRQEENEFVKTTEEAVNHTAGISDSLESFLKSRTQNPNKNSSAA